MEFNPRVFDFELPLDAFLFGVAVSGPGCDFVTKFFNCFKTSALHALSCQRRQFIFRNIQPASMFRRMAKLQTFHQ